MKTTAQFIAIGALTSAFTLAGARSGLLVDADCYEMLERNVTQKDPEANHDRVMEVRECAPKAKTKVFGVAEEDGQMFKLDPAANGKVTALLGDNKKPIRVSVSGAMEQHNMKVDSIAADSRQ